MQLSALLKAQGDLRQKARLVWEHYETRQLRNDLEPQWVHPCYQAVKDFYEGLADEESVWLANEIIASHEMPDGKEIEAFPGMPGSPTRIIHDGWKLGTTTWIFMGRTFCQPQLLKGGWVLISRQVPTDLLAILTPKSDVVWMAYNLNIEMGGSFMSDDSIGPCYCREEVVELIDELTNPISQKN